MRKRGSIVCKWRPCLPKGPTNSAQMCTIVTAALQRQYLQTELILWIRLVSSADVSGGRWRIGDSLLEIWECKIVIIFLGVGYHDWIVHHFVCYDPGSFNVFWNSYSPLTLSFKSFWSRMKFVVEVITIRGGLHDFLGDSCSSSLRVHESSSEKCEEVAS
jgi:hypothetical protein